MARHRTHAQQWAASGGDTAFNSGRQQHADARLETPDRANLQSESAGKDGHCDVVELWQSD